MIVDCEAAANNKRELLPRLFLEKNEEEKKEEKRVRFVRNPKLNTMSFIM